MNILHLYFSLGVGGAENILISILKNIDKKNFNSIVCTISDGGQVANQAEGLGCRVIKMGFKKINFFNRKKVILELERVVKELSIDLIHSNMYHANYVARVVGKKLNIPVVIAVHNTYKKVKWHRQFINWVYSRYTKKIIAGSNDIKMDILKYDYVAEDLVEVIPNAIDLKQSESALTKNQAKNQLGISEDHFVIGNVARLEEQKGQKYLLYALDQIVKSGNAKVKLLLVGDGRQKDELKSLVNQLNLSEQVLFLGTRSELGDLYRAMDVFVMPSLWEGLSLAMLSAMAADIPVIATKVGGALEVLNDGRGTLIRSENVLDLVAAINLHINSPAQDVVSIIKAKKYVEENHSNALMVRRYQNIFLE